MASSKDDPLNQLVAALRKKGITTSEEGWRLINDDPHSKALHACRLNRPFSRNGSADNYADICLDLHDLRQKLEERLGVDISEREAMRWILNHDENKDGRIGQESWGKLLGQKLKEAQSELEDDPFSIKGKGQEIERRPLLNAVKGLPIKNRQTPDYKRAPSPRVGGLPGKVTPRASTPSPSTPRIGEVKGQAVHVKKVKPCAGKDQKELSPSVEEFLEQELSNVVGLEMVKTQLRQMVKNIRVEERRKEMGMQSCSEEGEAYDMVFYGNPGTGKTSIARLIPKLLQKMQILNPKAPFLEVGRQDLVGAYIGATEANTVKKIEEAKRGVMFVDEAYTLTGSGNDAKDFGVKALETIMQCMTSNDKDRPIFVFAGYKLQMESFLQANPGMARRIAYKFHFEDYTPEQLSTIAAEKCRKRGLNLSAAARQALPRVLADNFTPNQRSLWNGGLASRLVSDSVQMLNKRLDPDNATREQLCTLEECDIVEGAKMSAQAVSALQAAVDDESEHNNNNNNNNNNKRTDQQATQSGSVLNTMHLKQHWPSALKRIAALENELLGLRVLKESGEIETSESLRDDIRQIKQEQQKNQSFNEDLKLHGASLNPLKGQQWIARKAFQVQGDVGQRSWSLIEEAMEDGLVGAVARDRGKVEDVVCAILALLRGLESSQEGSGESSEEEGGEVLKGDAGGESGNWEQGLAVGDPVPESWKPGKQFEHSPHHEFHLQEIVVVTRSDGRRTFGQVTSFGTEGLLNVLVGEGLQKSVGKERIGKIADARAEIGRSVPPATPAGKGFEVLGSNP